jgi:hypothetical protein
MPLNFSEDAIYVSFFNNFTAMKKWGRLLLYSFLLLGLLASCKKKPNQNEVAENLKTAMGALLNHAKQFDSTKVKFTVLDVSYFDDPKRYICQFKVNMRDTTRNPPIDTTGIMNADVSKDFQVVRRKD